MVFLESDVYSVSLCRFETNGEFKLCGGFECVMVDIRWYFVLAERVRQRVFIFTTETKVMCLWWGNVGVLRDPLSHK